VPNAIAANASQSASPSHTRAVQRGGAELAVVLQVVACGEVPTEPFGGIQRDRTKVAILAAERKLSSSRSPTSTDTPKVCST
jgi:hypothetical protein